MSTPEQNSEPSSVGEKPDFESLTKIHSINSNWRMYCASISEREPAAWIEICSKGQLLHTAHKIWNDYVLPARQRITELEKYNKYQADKWKELEAEIAELEAAINKARPELKNMVAWDIIEEAINKKS